MNEGISNDRVIESALDMIYRSKIKNKTIQNNFRQILSP
ncbi:hypothetical protein ECDEC5C_3707 [Escherichia coli DEC5C]|nr:hypothetical protein ECDEC5C_3707 [Escherichia coli DEC5C]EHX20886.1 hypothetical protein ECDEC12B_5694 [Escherichia coli DEC12B]EHX40901.1 hypothetical protein ECDEC12C_5444 [Escherichia coli DEC12C]